MNSLQDDSDQEKPCQLCIDRKHTRDEHKKLEKREYMRRYMYKRNEGKVSYRRWPLVEKEMS